MYPFITDRSEFKAHETRMLELVNPVLELPNNIFKIPFDFYLAFEFDFILDGYFYEGMQKFVAQPNDDEFVFYTLEPSPLGYFYKHFGKFSVGVFKVQDSWSRYDEFLDTDLKDEHDTLCILLNDVVIFSKSANWTLLASREWEVGIVGFSNLAIKQLFLDSFHEDVDIFFSIRKQVEIYAEMFKFKAKQWEEYGALIQNYKDKV